MTAAEISIEALCKRLHLANAPRIYRELAARAEQEQWADRDLLAVLLAEEVAHRQQTHRPLQHWGRVLHEPDLAQAIIDRVLERGRLFQLDGPSMGTRHLELDEHSPREAPSLATRISGIAHPEFPEPTWRDSSMRQRLASGRILRAPGL